MTTAKSNNVVRVGVGVIVLDPSKPQHIMCGIRKGSHGEGKLALPGGHLELQESWENCACREVLEECNLKLETPAFGHVTNDPMPDENKHYVTIFMMATCQRTDPAQVLRNMEPHKCEGWNSYTWEQLQSLQVEEQLFGPLNRLVLDSPSSVLQFIKTNGNTTM